MRFRTLLVLAMLYLYSILTAMAEAKNPAAPVFYLYPVYADLNLDGKNEKAYIKSFGGGATDQCPKYLIIEKLDQSGKYKVVYKDKQISGNSKSGYENWTAVFDTSLDEWAKKNKSEPAGLFVEKRKGERYPILRIVFAAGCGDIREYQYNPKKKAYVMIFGGD